MHRSIHKIVNKSADQPRKAFLHKIFSRNALWGLEPGSQLLRRLISKISLLKINKNATAFLTIFTQIALWGLEPGFAFLERPISKIKQKLADQKRNMFIHMVASQLHVGVWNPGLRFYLPIS